MRNTNPNTVTPLDTYVLAPSVDRLGVLLAQIADLTKQANEIKAELKRSTCKTFDGALFRAVVVEQEKTTYDVDVLKSAAPQSILDLARRESFVVSVKVTARMADE